MDLRERTRQAGGRAGSSAVDTAFFVALLWVVEIIDVITRHAVDRFASLRAWEFTDLPSIFTFSFAHYGWAHLIGNTALLLPFGFLLGLSGRRVAVQVTLVVMVCTGLAAWALTPPHSATAGASGIVFGWLTYLIVRGEQALDRGCTRPRAPRRVRLRPVGRSPRGTGRVVAWAPRRRGRRTAVCLAHQRQALASSILSKPRRVGQAAAACCEAASRREVNADAAATTAPNTARIAPTREHHS